MQAEDLKVGIHVIDKGPAPLGIGEVVSVKKTVFSVHYPDMPDYISKDKVVKYSYSHSAMFFRKASDKEIRKRNLKNILTGD